MRLPRVLTPLCSLAAMNAASACSCTRSTIEQGLADKDTIVFAADVDAARTVMHGDEPWIELDLSQVLPYEEGRLPTDKVRTPAQRSMCGKPVLVPERYWFFTSLDGVFYSCSATAPVREGNTGKLTLHVKDRLIEMQRNPEAAPHL